jgi:hypothetical protein
MAASLVMPAPLCAAEAVLVGAGDIAKCGSTLKNAEATAKLLDRFLERLDPDRRENAVVFTVGDNVYPRGRASEFTRCYDPTWGRHKTRTRPSIGNHDHMYRLGEAYYLYFGPAAGERGKGYYSYSLGDWHVVVLNSLCGSAGGCSPGSPQYEWLAQDLKKNARPCTVAYMHHPFFSSGRHGPSPELRPLVSLLYEAGVELMLAGHEHNYERFAPQAPDGRLDAERGIRQFIVGTGGREHRRLRSPKPNSEVRDNTSFGVLRLDLHPNSFEWEFVPVEGAPFRDSGGGRCH